MIVLDTSALVEFLVGADVIAEKVRSVVRGHSLAAPHALDLECVSTLRGLALAGKLNEEEAELALDLLASMDVRRHEHVWLLPRIWELRHNMWPYDAAYVALAEALAVDLVTVDAKLERVPGLRCRVLSVR